jgi:hypothetical protein
MAIPGESLLNKVVGWGKWSAERNSRVQWPANVLDYLEKEFRLLPKDMATLRCVSSHMESFGGQPARFIRVFDSATAYKQNISIKSYHDLDKHPGLILFEGHIFNGGTVYLRSKESQRYHITSFKSLS